MATLTLQRLLEQTGFYAQITGNFVVFADVVTNQASLSCYKQGQHFNKIKKPDKSGPFHRNPITGKSIFIVVDKSTPVDNKGETPLSINHVR
jgi:hypothetical protein